MKKLKISRKIVARVLLTIAIAIFIYGYIRPEYLSYVIPIGYMAALLGCIVVFTKRTNPK